MEVLKELKRDDIRRSLSAILMDTSDGNKRECDIWMERRGSCAKAEYLYQDPCGGEIAVGMDYSGYKEEKDFDDLAPDMQQEIFERLFMYIYGRKYEPRTLMERAADGTVTPILVVGSHMLQGGAYSLIDTALRERLGKELDDYMSAASKKGATCGARFYLLTKNLSAGKSGTFLGRDYYFEQTSSRQDIDLLIRLTPAQEALAKEMQALYERMQEAHIAFALNEDGSVVVYNAEHIGDCEGCDVFGVIPDGYEPADLAAMHTLFQVWTGDVLCLQRDIND